MDFSSQLIYSNQSGMRVLRHSLFWIIYVITILIIVSAREASFTVYLLILILSIPPFALATYFTLYYLIPLTANLPKRRNEVILWGLLLVLFSGIGMRIYKYYLIAPLVDPTHRLITAVWDIPNIVYEVLNTLLVVCMAVSIKLLKSKNELQHHNDQLQHEKKLSELNFLKAQMQPHFLFNTLNTLYSEAIQDSGKGQQIVLHLSNLLRFILDECNKPMIAIADEIKVIKDFIALEKLRHGSRLNIDFKIGEFDYATPISPLILLPFVENSFKHTLSRKRGDIEIKIEINKKGDFFYLLVENDFEEDPNSIYEDSKKGIANSTRQLDLLYGKKYELTVAKTGGKYSVVLKIPSSLQPT